MRQCYFVGVAFCQALGYLFIFLTLHQKEKVSITLLEFDILESYFLNIKLKSN